MRDEFRSTLSGACMCVLLNITRLRCGRRSSASERGARRGGTSETRERARSQRSRRLRNASRVARDGRRPTGAARRGRPAVRCADRTRPAGARQLQFPSAGGYGDALGVFLYWRGGLSLHAQEAEFSGNALDTRVGFWAQHLGAERDLSGRARAGARALARIHASRARALSRACAHGARSHALPRAHAPWPTLAHSHAHTPRSCSHSRAYLPLPTSRHRWASITYCRFAHLLDNRSLECWARHFPRFAEVIHAGGAKGPLSDRLCWPCGSCVTICEGI